MTHLIYTSNFINIEYKIVINNIDIYFAIRLDSKYDGKKN